MFRAKTVFILGAGASAEVGLPVGDGLLANISKIIDLKFSMGDLSRGDDVFVHALKSKVDDLDTDFRDHVYAAWQIVASSQQAISIDNIVDALDDPKVELVAKLAIVRAIHVAESQSDFFKESRERPGFIGLRKFGSTWYSHLTKLICENRKRDDVENIFENVSFVSFNYDRCLEHYLPKSIANYYGEPENIIQQLVKALRIHRPYGIAGKLPWQDTEVAAADFGGGNSKSLAEAASEIRTFTQGMGDNSQQAAMHEDLLNAERIVFLGSAFHRQNLELLKVLENHSVEILATASGISKSDQRVVKNELAEGFGIDEPDIDKQIILAEMHCEQFFREYWRTLTAGPPNSYFPTAMIF